MTKQENEIFREFRDHPSEETLVKVLWLKATLTKKLINKLAIVTDRVFVNNWEDISDRYNRVIIQDIKDVNALIKRPSCKEIVETYLKR